MAARMMVTPLLGALVLPTVLAQKGGQNPNKIPAPDWLPDQGKDSFNDIEEDANYFGESACEHREKLLKMMAGKGDKGATEHRVRVLLGLGLCDFRRGDWSKAQKRLDSCISEMNVPSEDFMMKNVQLAPYALMKQSANLMVKGEVTQASTQLRRTREIIERNIKAILKMLMKQMSDQGQEAPPLEMIVAEISGFGKTGQYMPQLMTQYPVFKQDLKWAEIVEAALDELDKKIVTVSPAQKDKKIKLSVSSKSREGSLLYVRGLATEATAETDRALVAQELEKDVAKAFVKEGKDAEKGGSLVKRTKDGSGCKAPFEKTCEAVKKIADVQSNGFGETRVVIVKSGKSQALDSCTTNANIGILLAAKNGATCTVGKNAPVTLEEGKALVVDFCQAIALDASEASVPVLFAQAWHPEFAAVERTTELRARAKTFGLSDDDQKAVTKVVNDFAKKSWDKAASAWRKTSPLGQQIRDGLTSEADAKKAEAEAAAAKARKDELEGDEDRQKNLAALEEKRKQKREKAEALEEKQRERKRELEAQKRNRDPWLNFPEVIEVENQLDELKSARRDANAKLEFDLSTQLTKDISKAEQELQKQIKKAHKAHKKGATGGDAVKETPKETPEERAKKEEASLNLFKTQVAEAKAKMAKAVEDEDFEAAKKYKDRAAKLEVELKNMERKAAKKDDGAAKKAAELKVNIEDLKTKKAKASADEDFDAAAKFKGEQKKLEDQLQKLEL